MQRVDRDGVLEWVNRYEQVWRDEDGAGIPTLFSADARYRRSPYEASIVGDAAITEFWGADDGEAFTMEASVVAVDGVDAVVRADVRYGEDRTLWVLHFADDGRVDDFEEWPLARQAVHRRRLTGDEGARRCAPGGFQPSLLRPGERPLEVPHAGEAIEGPADDLARPVDGVRAGLGVVGTAQHLGAPR